MDYNGINAKVSGMFGRLLRRADYEALSRARSVEEAGALLAAMPAYKRVLAGADMRRGVIERRLTLSLHEDFNRIYGFINDFRIKRFLAVYFLKNEVYAIKQLLCMAYDERDISADLDDVSRLLFRLSRIDVTKLKTAMSVPELIEGLKDTEFYPVLSRAYDEKGSMFELELQLDLYYYMRLREGIAALDRVNARLFDELDKVETDLRNIIWIYRLKTYYQTDGSLIYTYLIPSVHKLTKEYLNKLVNAGTRDELIGMINTGPYGDSFSASERPESAYELEMSRLCARLRRQRPRSLAAVAAYMFFKEQEIMRVTSVLEGVRYGLNPGDIMSLANGGRSVNG